MNIGWERRAVRMKRNGFKVWKIAESVGRNKWEVIDCLVRFGVVNRGMFKLRLYEANRKVY